MRWLSASLAGSISLLAITAGCGSPTPAARLTTPSQRLLIEGMADLSASLVMIDSALGQGPGEASVSAYRRGRRAYKRIEGLLSYFNPIEIAEVNGPRTDDDDDALVSAGVPVGFQVIEAALFDRSIPIDTAVAEVRRMQAVIGQLRAIAATNPISDADALDVARMEVVRVSLLGLAGIDTDASGDAVPEAAIALGGLRELIGQLASVDTAERRAIDETLARAIEALAAEPGYETFNRLRFLVAFAEPAARAINRAQRTLGGGSGTGQRRLWRPGAPTPFEAAALDPMAFAPSYAPAPTPDLVGLGRKLFFDPRLAGSRDRSCATCHQPDRAFTDGRVRALPLPGHSGAELRNTPTLLNVALQPRLFADDRTRELEAQIDQVLASPAEMASSADSAAARLREDSGYRAAFRAVFPGRGDSAIGGAEVRLAIAAYLRTVVSFDSRFDRAVRGDTAVLSASERAGFTVFMGKARCGTCHFLPLFNGVAAPELDNAEAEIIGVPRRDDFRRPELDPDPGRLVVEGVETNRFAFKVPTLRNVALTAPYMHNGVFPTLERVVEFYDRGGGQGIGLAVANQTLSARPLRLTPIEKRDLVTFMMALTDTSRAALGR